jgi:hypothetical protein
MNVGEFAEVSWFFVGLNNIINLLIYLWHLRILLIEGFSFFNSTGTFVDLHHIEQFTQKLMTFSLHQSFIQLNFEVTVFDFDIEDS